MKTAFPFLSPQHFSFLLCQLPPGKEGTLFRKRILLMKPWSGEGGRVKVDAA